MSENIKSKSFYILIFMILITAFFLRIYLLELRPLHSDEGVNFMFMDSLMKRNHYQYDPENYHGPTLYYMTLIPLYFFGTDTSDLPDEILPDDDFVYRICPMLLGFGVVLMLIPLRRYLGNAGLLTAMAFAAISPTAVYYSKDNIHEMYLMFFTVAAIVTGYLFFTTSKNRYLYLTAAFIALMYATKETTMVNMVIWCIAFVCASFFTTDKISNLIKRPIESLKVAFSIYKKPIFIFFILVSIMTLILILFMKDSYAKHELKWHISLLTKGIAMITIFTAFLMLFKNMRAKFWKILIAWVVFFVVLCIFFSSFFTHADGVGKFFKAFEMWTHQGTEGSKHTKSFGYFFKILLRFEWPILFLGFIGIIFAFWKRKPMDLFIAFSAIGTFFAFSLIPYKTPWCVQNIMVPLFLLSGLAIKYLFELTKAYVIRCAYVAIILVIFFMSLSLSADVNFINYDYDNFEIVYVQTNRSAKNLLNRVNELINVKYEGTDTKIMVDTDGTLPLNWYFRNHKLFWFNSIPNDLTKYSIVIGNKKQEQKLDTALGTEYRKENYNFNPSTGNALLLYFKDKDYVEPPPQKLFLTDVVDIKDESKLEPGLYAIFYQNVYYRGKKLGKQIDKSINFRYDSEEEKPYPAPFSTLWEGFIKIPKTGDYFFSTISDDGSYIYIDDKLAVDNGGVHGMVRQSKEIYLKEGYHKIKIKYFDAGGGAIIQLKWMQIGKKAEEIITEKHLFH